MDISTLTLVAGYLVCGLVGILGVLVLWNIADGRIDLSRLISEPNGDASLSRFQFLVFTFVIALSLFLVIVSAERPSFPDIPGTVLSLLGISASSYLVSKGIQFSDPAGVADRSTDIVISPATAIVRYGQTQQFKADVPRKPGSTVKWQVIAGIGTISAAGLYTAPPAPPAETTQQQHATIQVTSDEFPDASDLAVITLA
jgi:hypothetical protein